VLVKRREDEFEEIKMKDGDGKEQIHAENSKNEDTISPPAGTISDEYTNSQAGLTILKSGFDAGKCLTCGNVKNKEDADVWDSDDEKFEEIKVATMYSMIKDVVIKINGMDIPKKVLYLTNNHAVLLDKSEAAMVKCIENLGIGKPRFVIKLLASLGVRTQMEKAHKEFVGSKDELNEENVSYCEINKKRRKNG